MAVTDWKFPGTCANVDRDGKEAWSNPDNAKTSNDSRATCTIIGVTYNDWLRCTNFGFTTDDVPSGATIDGFEVKIERKASSANKIKDSALYLRDSIEQVGDNKATDTLWTTSDVEEIHGASDDDWNAGLSDADVRDSSFGIDFSAYCTIDWYSAQVDCVSIRVHYTEAVTVTPGTLNLTITEYIPVLKLGIIPPLLAHTLTSYAPVLKETLTPSTLSLTTTGYLPVLKEVTTPPTLSLTVTEYAPVLKEVTTPGVLALTTTGYAPVLKEVVTPSTLSLTLTSYTPVLKEVLTPQVLALTLTFHTPSISATARYFKHIVTLIPEHKYEATLGATRKLITMVYEYYNTGADSWDSIKTTTWDAQTFTPLVAHKIKSIKLKLSRAVAESPETVTVGIRATDENGHPTGDDLCSGTIDGNGLNSTLPILDNSEWYTITLGAGYNLVADTKYAIVVRAPDSIGAGNIVWLTDSSSPTYTRGNNEWSDDSGESWTTYTDYDMMFEEWGGTPRNIKVSLEASHKYEVKMEAIHKYEAKMEAK